MSAVLELLHYKEWVWEELSTSMITNEDETISITNIGLQVYVIEVWRDEQVKTSKQLTVLLGRPVSVNKRKKKLSSKGFESFSMTAPETSRAEPFATSTLEQKLEHLKSEENISLWWYLLLLLYLSDRTAWALNTFAPITS